VYRNTTPATPASKIQPAGQCGNINGVDQLRHPRSVAYSAGCHTGRLAVF